MVPEWDLTDRLAKSLKVSGTSVQEMADYLDVHRNTVSAWINGRTPPSTQSLRLWALRTGFPFDWLRDGDQPPGPFGPDGSSLLPRQESNLQPPGCDLILLPPVPDITKVAVCDTYLIAS